jgi:hypothetical protein
VTTPRERRLIATLRFIAAMPGIYAQRPPDNVRDQMASVARETVSRECEQSNLLHLMKKEGS